MKIKLWINIVTFAAVGVIVFFAWGDIIAAFERMRTLNLWVLSLMVPAQIFTFFALAKLYQQFFKALGVVVPLKTLCSAVIELNFVNHVFPSGGVSGFSYFAFRLKQDGVSAAKSTLAQLARYVFTFGTFVGLLLVALILLILEDHASRLIISVVTALMVTILFGTLGTIYIIGSEDRIESFSRAAARFLNRILHIFNPKRPEIIRLGRVERMFRELHKDYVEYRSNFGKMRPALLWAVVASVSEIAVVYIAFAAHDAWVNPGALIIAYAVATVSGLLAILPGGLGVYEPIMAGVLLSAGVPNDVAVSATLVSRVVTLLLALITGYVLYHKALKRHGIDRSKS